LYTIVENISADSTPIIFLSLVIPSKQSTCF
jgi:hypothetical protein